MFTATAYRRNPYLRGAKIMTDSELRAAIDEFLLYCLERAAYMQDQRVAGDWREATIKPMRVKLKALLATERTAIKAALPEKKSEDINVPDTLHRNIGYNQALTEVTQVIDGRE